MSTDEKDLHDPRNPCYDDKPRKLFISKPKFKTEQVTYKDGTTGTISWIPMPGVDYEEKKEIPKTGDKEP